MTGRQKLYIFNINDTFYGTNDMICGSEWFDDIGLTCASQIIGRQVIYNSLNVGDHLLAQHQKLQSDHKKRCQNRFGFLYRAQLSTLPAFMLSQAKQFLVPAS